MAAPLTSLTPRAAERYHTRTRTARLRTGAENRTPLPPSPLQAATSGGVSTRCVPTYVTTQNITVLACRMAALAALYAAFLGIPPYRCTPATLCVAYSCCSLCSHNIRLCLGPSTSLSQTGNGSAVSTAESWRARLVPALPCTTRYARQM